MAVTVGHRPQGDRRQRWRADRRHPLGAGGPRPLLGA
jgi:hypothetical protein